MTQTLLWDRGAGEIRAALVESGSLKELRIIRPRRQKGLYAAGEHYTARIVENVGQGKALVSIGDDVDALLEHAPKCPEGTLLPVEMTRAPIPEPGRWKRAVVRPGPDTAPQAAPGWHFSAEPWVHFVRQRAETVDEIVCADAIGADEVRRELGGHDVSLRIDADMVADADFDGLIDTAVNGEFPIADGMLSIERTRAMTVIDIDGSGDPLALNLAAAREIPRLLRLLDIGGQVGIDFLALPDRRARLTVDAALADACAALGPHERTAINGFGFAQIVRQRRGPSVPEILCGITPRVLSLESRAIALLRAAGRSTGHGKRQLVAPPPMIDLIRNWPEETLALQSALGVAIELVSDSTANGYGHVHVSQS